MRPKVFVAQPAVEAALDILREAADVTVYPYLDRQITADELAANSRRADWLMLISDNIVTAEIIEGAPNLRGIGTVSTRGLYIDLAAATARKVAVVTSDPAELEGEGASIAVRGGVSLATADLTMGMLLGLAYRSRLSPREEQALAACRTGVYRMVARIFCHAASNGEIDRIGAAAGTGHHQQTGYG